ncbi:hypothetical protein DIPPA_01749 [Diplonema papillatum]|nr:hypothetical protein DIPPA_01749 [Diplonema papillatum]
MRAPAWAVLLAGAWCGAGVALQEEPGLPACSVTSEAGAGGQFAPCSGAGGVRLYCTGRCAGQQVAACRLDDDKRVGVCFECCAPGTHCCGGPNPWCCKDGWHCCSESTVCAQDQDLCCGEAACAPGAVCVAPLRNLCCPRQLACGSSCCEAGRSFCYDNRVCLPVDCTVRGVDLSPLASHVRGGDLVAKFESTSGSGFVAINPCGPVLLSGCDGMVCVNTPATEPYWHAAMHWPPQSVRYSDRLVTQEQFDKSRLVTTVSYLCSGAQYTAVESVVVETTDTLLAMNITIRTTLDSLCNRTHHSGWLGGGRTDLLPAPNGTSPDRSQLNSTHRDLAPVVIILACFAGFGLTFALAVVLRAGQLTCRSAPATAHTTHAEK